MSERKYCHNCGELIENLVNVKYCPYCGQSLQVTNQSSNYEANQYNSQDVNKNININKTINKNINRFNRDEYYDESKVKTSEHETLVKLKELESKEIDNRTYLIVMAMLIGMIMFMFLMINIF